MPGVLRTLRLCAAVVCVLWGLLIWETTARTAFKAHSEIRATGASTSSRITAASARENLPGAGAGGAIELRLSPRPGDGWRLTAHYRLVLRTTDPLVDRLRADPRRIREVVDVLPGGTGVPWW